MSAVPRGGEPTTARCKWLAFATLMVSTCAWPLAAGALPTDINMSPPSGPVGTTVTVSGSGCGPGLLSGTSSVRVLSATLSVDVTVSANAAGSWSTQFVVPSDAVQLTHAIAATCVQDLVPVPYLPQSFTVVAAPTTASPTTQGASASDSGVASGSPTGRPSGGGATGAQPASTTAGPSSSSTSAPPSADSEVAAGRVEASRTGTGAVAFDSAARSRWTWLGWVAWAMAIVAVAVAAIAAVWFTWLRHTRARLWWERWLQQVARLRGLGRS